MGGVFSKKKKENKRRECSELIHAGKAKPCTSKHCQRVICENCASQVAGKPYCMLCALSKQDDDEIDEKALARATKLKDAKHEISVKFDQDRGEIIGWEQFFAMFANDDLKI